MSDSMIERVAEAIFLKEGRAKDVAWEDADKVLALSPWERGKRPPKVSDYYRDIARAAIEAMRKPTEAMIAAMRNPSMAFDNEAPGPIYPDERRREDIEEMWGEGIDAALKGTG